MMWPDPKGNPGKGAAARSTIRLQTEGRGADLMRGCHCATRYGKRKAFRPSVFGSKWTGRPGLKAFLPRNVLDIGRYRPREECAAVRTETSAPENRKAVAPRPLRPRVRLALAALVLVAELHRVHSSLCSETKKNKKNVKS